MYEILYASSSKSKKAVLMLDAALGFETPEWLVAHLCSLVFFIPIQFV